MKEYRYIAKIDSAESYMDYGQSERCVRLIAVDIKDFLEESFNLEDGCPTYLFDISWRVLMSKSARPPRWLLATYRMLEARLHDVWLDVRFQLSELQSEGAYFYELFADAQPTYINIHSINFFLASTTVKAARQFVPSSSMSGAFELTAFHVGQGMCSLLSSGQDAVFLDLGAGTPLKRSAYPALGLNNHISSALSSLSSSATLLAVISHPDSDHWRLLDWDSSLAGAINSIVMPSNVPSLALKSHRLTNRVYSAGDFALQLGAPGDYLRAYRSAPSLSDRNGECLVCEVEIGGRMALIAGDYVYHRMATDAHPGVQALCAKSYDAVVVPHHGDKASARAVPSGARPGKSLAFFSAGDHRRYGHPHPRSQGAHLSRGYREVLDKHRTDIRGVRLLP